jgi:hypothetical protein
MVTSQLVSTAVLPHRTLDHRHRLLGTCPPEQQREGEVVPTLPRLVYGEG